MSVIRFVGTNQELGEWLKTCSKVGVFISHLKKRQIPVPEDYALSWRHDRHKERRARLDILTEKIGEC